MISFEASSTEIRVYPENQDEFMQEMAKKVPYYQSVLSNPDKAPRFAVEAIFKDHPDWFDFLFVDFRATRRVGAPQSIVSECVRNGFALLQAVTA